MDKMLVLMSTYNGQEYIEEQINSIFKQKNLDIELMIRDDGSTDGTIEIIKRISPVWNGKIKLYLGRNIGYEKSFLFLIYHAKSANYYAFADQDDVWDTDKLYTATKYIKQLKSVAGMYCSNVRVVNQDLVYSHELQREGTNYINKGFKFLNSGAMGCTIVFNKYLLDILQSYSPKYIWPHDYWVTTVALYVGKVYYDASSHMSYRQHCTNVTGGDMIIGNRLKKSFRGLKTYFTNRWSKLAEELIRGFSRYISNEDIGLLKLVSEYQRNIKYKYRLLFDNKISKKNKFKNIFFKISILINRA